MNFEFFTARRIIASKDYKSSVSAPIIKIAISAITLGMVIMLVTIATSVGLQKKIREKVSAFNGDIIISNFDTNTSDESQVAISKNQNFYLHFGDMSDSLNLSRVIKDIKPHEIYNLAAMSHVHVSFELPEYVGNVDALGTLRILEVVRQCGFESTTKIYQASTSELFGKAQEFPQNENTPFYPRSPYGISKLYAHWMTQNYRESYDIFACSGILFNHESPLRGLEFVTRKITDGVARINSGEGNCLELGNLDASRDWGYAPEFVEGMYRMMQYDTSDTFVLATNRAVTVKRFTELAFEVIGTEIIWEGAGVKEKGIDKKNSNKRVFNRKN